MSEKLHKMVDGVKVYLSDEEETQLRAEWAKADEEQKARAWLDGRINEYPALGDQFDMLWHAMDNKEIPKANSFYDAIKTIKDKYPKPS